MIISILGVKIIYLFFQFWILSLPIIRLLISLCLLFLIHYGRSTGCVCVQLCVGKNEHVRRYIRVDEKDEMKRS
jgi:hypothetical protein